MSDSVFMLWLENVDPELFSAVPSLRRIASEGVDIRLNPLLLAEERVCYYQTLTGMGSGKSGYFDAVKPVAYHVYPEEDIPEGVLGRLLPDILRKRGLVTTFVEIKKLDELAVETQQVQPCTIVRTPVENDVTAIENLVNRYREHLLSDTHLLVLTDVWHRPAARYVNANNFLADRELIEVGKPRGRGNIDWTETLAYFLGSGQIWVNLSGREPEGRVTPGQEYQQVCEALQQELLSWQDPYTGEAIVKQVLKKEDAYAGEYLFKAPDLIVEYHPGYIASPLSTILDFDPTTVYPANINKAGRTRTAHARLIGRGPNLISGFNGSTLLVDVMPSVMYLLGQPAPAHVDGKVISTLFTPSHRQQYPQERTEDDESLLTSEEEGHIEDRLRALGYLG